MAVLSLVMSPRSIGEFEDDPRARHHLDLYTDPCGHYAFNTYDEAAVHDGPLTAADVLMANLLGLRLGWRDVIPLFAAGRSDAFTALRVALDGALVEARRLPPLECCTEEQVAMPALRHANEVAAAVSPPDGKPRTWTIVTVSKVLHRLSPNIPIIDSHVKRFYGSGWAGQIRRRLREDLARNWAWMAPVAQNYPVRGRPLPLNRMADICIWMDATRG
jgi:Family of unknown function (DUF6308)